MSWTRNSREIDENSATFNDDDDDEALPVAFPSLTHCSLDLLPSIRGRPSSLSLGRTCALPLGISAMLLSIRISNQTARRVYATLVRGRAGEDKGQRLTGLEKIQSKPFES